MLVQVAQAGPSAVDASGRTVALDAPAQRIVALAPHSVENVYSAGAGDRLVGVVSYSDYPEPARELPQVGSAFAWSLEAVVAMRPDLVILWGSGNGLTGLAGLERLGVPTYVSEPRSFADIASSIRAIGALAGTRDTAEAAAAAFEARIAALRERYASARRLRAFYEIWNQPLQTVNGEHMISQVLELCAAQNIFAELAPLAPRVNIEAVLAADPEVIVASGMDRSRPEWLDEWLRFPELRAVRNDALVHVDPDLLQRPTARIAEGATRLCAKLDGVRAVAQTSR
ncbi:cobalamin-binding protein [Mangrovimicrobium sediminis]|uniref:Cobalamin-binding protein n=2 Tax=Mangrovimicrobium sediminis TaxID=2562682 RepID=A0A4Z0M666_9GAMM|nr:cobalamin-binding protein [Haliea sp. SAOS-164]